MALNTLNFNKGKTQVLIIGPCDAPRMDLEPYVKPTGKNLGVNWTTDKNSAVKSNFFSAEALV